MKLLAILSLAVLVSGCVCCGDLVDIEPTVTDTTEPYCSPPYIQVGSDCCLDMDSNGICDSEESVETAPPVPPPLPDVTSTTSAPVVTQPPATTSSTTSTQPQASCSDGIQNQGEEYIDCGGPCSNCEVFTLGGWREFMNTGYRFRYDGKEGSGSSLKYWVLVETPDGLGERMHVSTAEMYLDYLRFKVIDYGEDPPRVYVKVNAEDLGSVPPQASLITIGGQSCLSGGTEMCERNYAGYTIRMMNRIDDGARVSMVGPTWEVPAEVQVKEGRLSFSPDHTIAIGGFFDRSHIMTGGYSLFYVYVR